jgi:hypothetical protein
MYGGGLFVILSLTFAGLMECLCLVKCNSSQTKEDNAVLGRSMHGNLKMKITLAISGYMRA